MGFSSDSREIKRSDEGPSSVIVRSVFGDHALPHKFVTTLLAGDSRFEGCLCFNSTVASLGLVPSLGGPSGDHFVGQVACSCIVAALIMLLAEHLFCFDVRA